MSEETGERKSEDATPGKLNRQRKKGQFAKSEMLPDLSKYLFGIIFLLISSSVLMNLIDDIFVEAAASISKKQNQTFDSTVNEIGLGVFFYIITFMLGSLLVVLVTHGIYAGGLTFSAEPISPKFDKLSIGKGLKRIFGRRSQVEAWTGVVRILLWICFSAVAIIALNEQILGSLICGIGCTALAAEQLFRIIIGASIVFCIVTIIIDLLLQRNIFLHEMKMTKSELKRDIRESFGDPHIKDAQRLVRDSTTIAAEDIITEHKTLSEDVFLVVGRSSVIAVRLSLADQHPLPIIVTSSDFENSRSLIAEASSRNLKIISDSAFADSLGHGHEPGVVMNQKHFPALVKLLEREQLV